MEHRRFHIRQLLLTILTLALAAPLAYAANLPSGFRETLVASGLANPTLMAIAPDGRIFVSEQGGRLRVIKNGSLLSTPFVTLPVSASGERGLLGIAFDLNFSSNGYVYVYYTATSPSTHNRVSRFTASGDVASGGETPIFDLDNLNATNHNGGAIHFGPDGKLYIASGDNGNSSNAQSLNTVLGKMLRINADGSIPSDNPFYNSTSGKNRAIWAIGLRNPFSFAFNPQGGRMFINDVGEVSWEEVNDGRAGANYGWPDTEGSTSDSRFVSPSHTYNNDASVCAITGGAFYAPAASQFPADHYGDYFFGDYCGWWIRRMDPTSGAVTGFATAVPMPVDVKVSSDGALYYLARGSGSSSGVVYKVEYGSGATAPGITMHPANQTAAPGGSATFSVGASGQQPLQYQWQRNGSNISGATSSIYTISPVSMSDNGAQFRAVVSNGAGSATSNAAGLTVTSNSAPVGTIAEAASGTLYTAGSEINYAGTATDAEDGTVPASRFTWQVDFHHDTHSHPFIQPASGSTSGSFTVPTTGHTEPNVWFRIYLTVTDSAGLTHQTYREVYPRKSALTLATSPAGLQLKLEGQPIATPITVDSVVGVIRTLEAPTPVTSGGTTYEFVSWSDGGAAQHTLSTPASNTTYTATYRVVTGGGGGGGTPININFQPASSPAYPGYLTDTGVVYGDRGNGQMYGWNTDNTAQMRDRNNSISPDQRYDSFAHMQWSTNPNAVWEIAVPNGSYTVHIVGGDPTSVDGTTRIEAEGVLTVSGMPSSSALWIEGTSTVTVSDGRLTITSATGATVNKLSFLEITPQGSDPAPAISTVSPASGPVGTAVTITGTDFGAAQGTSTVTFNGTTATASSWSATSIEVTVPPGATTGSVLVTAGGQGSNGASFTVTSAPPSAPAVTSVSPNAGAIGTAVTITGADFGATQGTGTVTFNGTTATATSWSPTSIGVTVPAGATTGPVVVTVNEQGSNAMTFTVSGGGGGATPINISFQPASSPTYPGYLVDTGSVFGARGNGQTYGWNTDNSAQTRDRNNAISPDQRYDTFAHMQWSTNPTAFWEIAVPNGSYTVHIVGGDPTSVDGTTGIEAEGVLTASGMPSSSALWIEGTSTVTVSDGRLTIRSAPGASVNKLSFLEITPLGGDGGEGGGTPAPVISGPSPSSGPVGTAVTITGANFGSTQESSTVTFNGTTATASSWSATSIEVTVPAGATTGPVVVTVSGQASSEVNFTVSTDGGTLSSGRIGWWGPFQPGVAPNNRVPGMPNGVFVGSPTFTSDGGGGFTSTANDYLHVADGGAGGTYDWTSGAWSAQVDFTLPTTVPWNGYDHLLLVSKGSFNLGTGWEIQLNESMFQGKYQMMMEMNKGVGVYRNATAYVITPGAFNRALFVCDASGVGRWYVNGVASNTLACWAPSSGATDLTIGRYSAEPAYESSFPITRVQIWNRALTPAEATQSTTTDPQ